jgi:hypothetical protein
MADINMSATEIEINGVKYVPKGTAQQPEPRGNAVIVRAKVGVFFGYIQSRSGGGEAIGVVLNGCRRIWSWKGAKTISEIATTGIDVSGSNVAVAVDGHEVFGVGEIAPCTAKAEKCLLGAKWTQ